MNGGGYGLAKEEHGADGNDDGDDGRDELVEEEGQRLHHGGVAQQQRDKQQVMALDQRGDAFCVFLFIGFSADAQHMQRGWVKREQAQCQAAEYARKHHQQKAHHHIDEELDARASAKVSHALYRITAISCATPLKPRASPA